MSDKIQISWDEVNSSAVDAKLNSTSALSHAGDHYEKQTAGDEVIPGFISRWMYNTFVYMAAFGLVGGISAWLIGEVIDASITNHGEKFSELFAFEMYTKAMVAEGEMTDQEATAVVNAMYERHADNPYVVIATDPSLSDKERKRQMTRQDLKDLPKNMIRHWLWFASMGLLLSLSLSVGDHVVSRNWRGAIINGSVGIILGMAGGVLVSLFINLLYGLLLGNSDSFFRQVFARTVGWAIFGGFLTLAPGVVFKNKKRMLIGLAGGVLGGTIGGMMFDIIGLVTDGAILSRFVAISAIGLVAGVGTGVIESVAKTGWLRVTGGLIAGKQFVLYKNPTYVGSSPQCEIYLFKDPSVGPRHAAIHKLPTGGYQIEDLGSGNATAVNGRPASRTLLTNGDSIQIGGTTFVFQERERAKT